MDHVDNAFVRCEDAVAELRRGRGLSAADRIDALVRAKDSFAILEEHLDRTPENQEMRDRVARAIERIERVVREWSG